ncbi:peptidase T [Lachnospiraceae bacterium OttesenSCG-928-E19]|nr:peptidase T [Lachnospiraceae bacterium OttesenSCG-928-E19]
MKAFERLLNYVTVLTPSDENSDTVPSSKCQFDLANKLVPEMKSLGLHDVYVDEKCYVYGKLAATPGHEDKTCIGLIAHLDTVSDFCDHDIVPLTSSNYDGKDFPIGTSGRSLEIATFKHLPELVGRTLITSDGTTILGADDKAGIAEILTLVERLVDENIPHGPISIAFTPDEEIGSGAGHLDLEKFGAKYAYTMDGGPEGEIEYENFNAAKAVFKINGLSVHPGSSKDTMINASLLAMEINAMLPGFDTPRDTEGYEGFYHLISIEGDVGSATINYFVRDHSKEFFEGRKETLRHIEKIMNEKWGADTVTLTIIDQYRNMAEIIDTCMQLIDHAKLACEKAGIQPKVVPIRGGTDGAQLSFRGLPCPNLGTGGYGFHGPYEHITVEGMDKAVDMLVELVQLFI